MSSTLTSI
jgi:hypothetical protein